jgi:hypothetical protein
MDGARHVVSLSPIGVGAMGVRPVIVKMREQTQFWEKCDESKGVGAGAGGRDVDFGIHVSVS